MCREKLLLLFLSGIALFVLCLLFPKNVSAATLGTVSDIISTSRPSASAPLNADQAASASQVTVVDNGSIYLASDSATLRADTGETQNTPTIASMSAQVSGTPNTRYVYFVATTANTHHKGDPLVVPISAMHTVSFIIPNAVPASGKIILTFPALTSGDANTAASPSATTFQLNNLSGTQISYKLDGTRTCSFAFTAPSAGVGPAITCTVDSGGSVPANTTLTFLIGCADGSSNETTCTTASPRIINPTKTAASGTADTWTLTIQTQDSNSVNIDNAKIRIATVESVLVQATVDPTLTVTIAGLSGSANFNSSSTSCVSETANSGLAATATTVNLGNLASGIINLAGQTITVTTNAQFGYSITATSSGRFIDPSSGVWITDANGGNGLTANDTPVPAVFPSSGNPAFGISPCGTRVASRWTGGSAFAFGSGAKASNPWNSGVNSYYATLTTYAGPAVSSDVTVIRYAATIASTTPAGTYSNVFTYVVTPTF